MPAVYHIRNYPSKKLLRFLLVFLPFSLIGSKLSAQTFDTILRVAPANRIATAEIIYKAKLRKRDSAYTFAQLDQLTAIAQKLSSKPLEFAVYDFKSDYYSVNQGFNARSIYYYDKVISLAQQAGMQAETAYYIFRKGQFFQTFKQYVPAYQDYLKAYDIYKTVGFENVADISDFFRTVAGFLYDAGDFDAAKTYLLQALRYYNDPVQIKRVDILNTIGLICRSQRDYPEALKYFNQALQIAQQNHIGVWVIIVNGNIGSVYFLEKDYKKALPLIQADYKGSLQYNERRNAAMAMLRLVKISIAAGDFKTANLRLDSAKALMDNELIFLPQWIDWYNLKAAMYDQTGQPALAAGYHTKYELAKDSLEKRNDILALEGIKLKWEADKHQAEVSRLENQQREEVRKRNTLLVVIGLLLVISILVYNRQNLVRKRDKALFEKQEALLLLEKAKAEEELLKARLELEDYTKSLMQKNNLIEKHKAEIEKLKRIAGPVDLERLGQLEQLMQAHIMTNENWLEFRKLFNTVHNGFFSRLNQLFTNLTETDIRILTLLKLGLKNREMANMLGVTIEGIKKSKQRLHKKTGFTVPDLEAYVAQI